MTTALRWTSSDLETLPDDSKRYEIIDGALYVSEPTDWYHQKVCGRILLALYAWSKETGVGRTNFAPGIIFGEHDTVAPDVIWISNERLASALDENGHLHAAPELAVEVLSPGTTNERRDREPKLKLYSQRGVQEYWIVDWQRRQMEVFRREDAALRLFATLYETDELQSPLLAGFACPVAALFADAPR